MRPKTQAWPMLFAAAMLAVAGAVATGQHWHILAHHAPTHEHAAQGCADHRHHGCTEEHHHRHNSYSAIGHTANSSPCCCGVPHHSLSAELKAGARPGQEHAAALAPAPPAASVVAPPAPGRECAAPYDKPPPFLAHHRTVRLLV